jgi:hypothetical protein
MTTMTDHDDETCARCGQKLPDGAEVEPMEVVHEDDNGDATVDVALAHAVCP